MFTAATQLEFESTLGVTPTRTPAKKKTAGEVFTRRWVVDLILDLSGYTAGRDLAMMVAVEPACGRGAFVLAMVDRLIASCAVHGRAIHNATRAIRAMDLETSSVAWTRNAVVARLCDAGVTPADALALAEGWIREGDYLLDPRLDGEAEFVLGNPPYVRLENIAGDLNLAYRTACPTMRGRSDLFVGFIERGLRDLKEGGTLGYIVADRWMRNQYGAGLRALIAGSYSVDTVVEMHGVAAFEDDVAAYPAITILRRSPQASACVAIAGPSFNSTDANRFRDFHRSPTERPLRASGIDANHLPHWFSGRSPWPSAPADTLTVISRLEIEFPALGTPESGTRIGIGVATGVDDIYLTKNPELVEAERLLPMVTAGDIVSGRVQWSGTQMINPWAGDDLVNLDDAPKLAAYLERHERRVRARHTAKKNPEKWYRTIDRVDPTLLRKPKLLFAEMKASADPVLEPGNLYPHHNLYHVTSEAWDLEVLGGLLLSEVSNLFISAYCVKMRGGTLRFQAQYLRQIRVPAPDSLSQAQCRALIRAFRDRDHAAATAVASEIYGVELGGARARPGRKAA